MKWKCSKSCLKLVTNVLKLWLHVIRSQGFSCLKRWLWWNIKSISWFGFKRMTWLASRYVFIRLPLTENGYQSACVGAAAAMNEPLFSILNGLYQIWEPGSQPIDVRISLHIIFNSNETMTEVNTLIKMRTLHSFTWEKHRLCKRMKHWDQTQCLDVWNVSQ